MIELSRVKARFHYNEASASVAVVEFLLDLLPHVGPPEPIIEQTTEDGFTTEVTERVNLLD